MNMEIYGSMKNMLKKHRESQWLQTYGKQGKSERGRVIR